MTFSLPNIKSERIKNGFDYDFNLKSRSELLDLQNTTISRLRREITHQKLLKQESLLNKERDNIVEDITISDISPEKKDSGSLKENRISEDVDGSDEIENITDLGQIEEGEGEETLGEKEEKGEEQGEDQEEDFLSGFQTISFE